MFPNFVGTQEIEAVEPEPSLLEVATHAVALVRESKDDRLAALQIAKVMQWIADHTEQKDVEQWRKVIGVS